MSTAASNLRRDGSAVSFHELTHEEPVDEKLGYQPKSTFFMEKSMETFATMLRKLDSIKEGDGTLLDHSLVFATSESNYAKLHTIDSLPIMIAGTAGGKWRSGQHINGKGDPTSRIGLTIQQAFGIPVGSWGTGAMATSKVDRRSRLRIANCMKQTTFSRRTVLARACQLSAAVALPLFTNAVKGKEAACVDPEQLSAGEISLRESVKYTDSSSASEKSCVKCAFFQASTDAPKCGRCQILNGSVSAAGHCTSWSPKS